jgi:two-component system, OmpR family, KDP operon response regulator KdpE
LVPTHAVGADQPPDSGAGILVVDDERPILHTLQVLLRGAGYRVETATTAREALTKAATQQPAAVVLDLLLPDGRGSDVCRELRKWTGVPILVLSAVTDEEAKVDALDAGADDYVTKPFSSDELLARLRATLRGVRASGVPALEVGELKIDLERRLVTMAGRLVSLTTTEYELLCLLARHAGRLLTQATILREVWGTARPEESNYLHVYTSRLRRKLEQDPIRPRYLLTEPGLGYRLVDPTTQA